MRLTVDTSVAIKWIVNEPGTEGAVSYLPRWDGNVLIVEHTLMAPALLGLELHNVIRKLYNGQRVSREQLFEAEFVLERFGKLDPVDTALVNQARRISFGARHWIAIAHEQPRPSPGTTFNIYDCIFVAHAHSHGSALLTADAEQALVARTIGIPVEFVES